MPNFCWLLQFHSHLFIDLLWKFIKKYIWNVFAIGAVAGDKSNRFYLFAWPLSDGHEKATANGKPIIPPTTDQQTHTQTPLHLMPFLLFQWLKLLWSVIQPFPVLPLGRDCILGGVRVCVCVCGGSCENSFSGDRNTYVKAFAKDLLKITYHP